jgi:hypothetical protein
MALAESLFQHIRSGTRSVPTSTIAAACHCAQPEQVESLLLEALALDLFQGRIDQLKGVVHVEAVQPRHLDPAQIGDLKAGFERYLRGLEEKIALVQANLAVSV